MTTRTKEQAMNHTQKSVATVLERITLSVKESAGAAEVYSEALDAMLDDLAMDDVFGTEGQSDPRGDFREGDWSMANVQGVDK
jgi:hypothetical protein